MIAGGFGDVNEKGSYEFTNMKATSNAATECRGKLVITAAMYFIAGENTIFTSLTLSSPNSSLSTDSISFKAIK
jgi:hypothetical protein